MSILGLLMGATIALHVEDATGVDLDLAVEVVAELAEVLTETTRARTIIDDPAWSPCARPAECLEEIRDRSRADFVVLVRVFGSVSFVRVRAERASAVGPPVSAEVDLPQESPEGARTAWRTRLSQIARTLFPDTAFLAEPVSAAGVVQGERRAPWWALGAFGGSALLLATSVAFGVSAMDAKSQIEATTLRGAAYLDQSSRLSTHRTLSNALAVGSVLAAGGALLLLAAER